MQPICVVAFCAPRSRIDGCARCGARRLLASGPPGHRIPRWSQPGGHPLSKLRHPESGRPFEVVNQKEVGRKGQFAVRDDLIRLPSGEEVGYVVVMNPDSVFVVPHFENGDTVLVRQWRHAWDRSSWEVPAGTLARGEDPLEGARRELEEEAGLRAQRWSPLGTAHGAAILTGTAHIYLAEGLSEVAHNREPYEQDMETMRLALKDALEAALGGDISHSTSITSLARAARALKLI